jgi:hypothetical protein
VGVFVGPFGVVEDAGAVGAEVEMSADQTGNGFGVGVGVVGAGDGLDDVALSFRAVDVEGGVAETKPSGHRVRSHWATRASATAR